MEKKKKRKRKWLRILLSALGVILITAVAVTIWQWNNISALITSRKYTTEELGQMLEDNEAKTEAILDKLPTESLRPLTEDEKEKLKSGELLEDEAVALVMSPALPPEPGGVKQTETPEPEASKPEAPYELGEGELKVAEQIARIYVLRDLMTANLDSLFSRAKDEYSSHPPEERTGVKRQQIAMKYLGEATSLENSCDAQMDAILKDLEGVLKDFGGDTSVVPEIRQAYRNEKMTKKAYYLNRYL
ncbi:MAG: hypothetical protein LBH28_11370 [Oscillospiraceae bacterium]|nr:hypothetical protein [Oscillospiraceae bacterium]